MRCLEYFFATVALGLSALGATTCNMRLIGAAIGLVAASVLAGMIGGPRG